MIIGEVGERIQFVPTGKFSDHAIASCGEHDALREGEMIAYPITRDEMKNWFNTTKNILYTDQGAHAVTTTMNKLYTDTIARYHGPTNDR